jgi:DNA (cytosine-5)-methyltransferase 1
MPGAYYNEIEPYAAQWLRNLIAAGLIAPGDVDERSIVEVRADDLRGYTQCHFFAGIGGWSYALRLAGWPDDRPVWTGSCPCQPYSVASVAHGGAQGRADERDLWPTWFALIRDQPVADILGEQVASAVQWGWWDRCAMDLESINYACGSAVLRADAFGADHQRRRLFWVADSGRAGRKGREPRDGFPLGQEETLAIHSDPFADARRALAGDYSGLLLDDGLSVAVERCATKGYGNAIVPQVAAEFVRAYLNVTAPTAGEGSQQGAEEGK